MLLLCIVLIVLLCAFLAACAFLYAERRNLFALVTRQDALLQKQDAQLTDWQNKALARNSMTPLGEEREEKAPSGQATKSESFDLRPPVARMQAQWDEEEAAEIERGRGGIYAVPLPSDVRDGLLEAAREVAQ